MAQNGNRALPHNHQVERALIGSLIVRNGALFEVMEIIDKEDFDEPANGEYYALLLDMIQAGRTVTKINLLEDTAQDADIGSERTASQYIHELVESAPKPTPEIVKGLAETIKDLARKRMLVRILEEKTSRVYAAPPSIRFEELRLEVDAEIATLYRSTKDLGVQHVAEIGEVVLSRAEKAREDDSLGVGVSTGIKQVDDLIGPLFPGDVLALGGAPGSGKSALAQQICAYVSRDQGDREPLISLYYSIEMPTEQVAGREFAKATGISPKKIRRGWQLDRTELGSLWDVNYALKKTGLYTVSSSEPTVAMVKATALRMKKLIGLHLLAVDHLQYLGAPSYRMKEVETVNANAIGIKQMAKDLGIPIILLCQLGSEGLREMEKWPHRAPRKGDLAYTGFVDRNSDMILLLHRRETWLVQNRPAPDAKHYEDYAPAVLAAKNIAEAILAKNRDGEIGDPRTLWFDGPRYRFNDNVTRSMLAQPESAEFAF